MNSLKPLQWVGIGLGLSLAMYFAYSHLYYFGNVSFLGGILLLEILVASLWRYDQRFFVLLMIAFLWAGMHVPMQGAWTSGRWVVLVAGAAVGCIAWMKTPRRPFGSFHLIAFFCICTAFVSATVSPFLQMASLKALSLFLLFLYCASGARLAVLGREDRFFHGLLWGTEIAVYITAICYFGLGQSIWGNPNSLGASMSVGLFPILLWGWFTSDVPGVKLRRLAALLLCAYLVFFSGARAGMAAVVLVTLIFCVCLHQYKLLVQVAALVLVLIAVTWDVRSRKIRHEAGGPEGCSALQGTQGRRRDGFEANTLGEVDRHDQRASAVRNGIWHEPNRRGSRAVFRICQVKRRDESRARQQLHDHRGVGGSVGRVALRCAPGV